MERNTEIRGSSWGRHLRAAPGLPHTCPPPGRRPPPRGLSPPAPVPSWARVNVPKPWAGFSHLLRPPSSGLRYLLPAPFWARIKCSPENGCGIGLRSWKQLQGHQHREARSRLCRFAAMEKGGGCRREPRGEGGRKPSRRPWLCRRKGCSHPGPSCLARLTSPDGIRSYLCLATPLAQAHSPHFVPDSSSHAPRSPPAGTSTWRGSGAPFMSRGEWVGVRLPTTPQPLPLGPLSAGIPSYSSCTPTPPWAWLAVGAQQGSPWTPGSQRFYRGTSPHFCQEPPAQATPPETWGVSVRTEGGSRLHSALCERRHVWDSELWNMITTSGGHVKP